MILFMGKKTLDRYVAGQIEKSFHDMVESYVQENITDVRKRGEENAKALWDKIQGMDSGFNSLHGRVEELGRKCNRLEAYTIKNEIEKCIQGMKNELAKDITAEILSKIPEPGVDSNEVKSLIDNSIMRCMKRNCEMPGSIKAELASMRAELSAYVNTAFQGLNQELDRKNAEAGRIWESVSGEKRKIAALEDTIHNQKKDIAELRALVRQLQNEISSLSTSVTAMPVQQSAQAPNSCRDANPFSAAMPPKCIFSEEPMACKNTLGNFVLQSKKLRDEVRQMPFGEEELGIYLKLIDKCIRKFEELEKKHAEKAYDPGKLAHGAAKILKQTIIRAMSQKGLKKCLGQYMEACHVRKLGWETGRKLDDGDYAYLEEPISYEKVPVPEANNTILEIMQDTFIIDYREEDGCFEAVIPGIYSIGKYRN